MEFCVSPGDSGFKVRPDVRSEYYCGEEIAVPTFQAWERNGLDVTAEPFERISSSPDSRDNVACNGPESTLGPADSDTVEWDNFLPCFGRAKIGVSIVPVRTRHQRKRSANIADAAGHGADVPEP